MRRHAFTLIEVLVVIAIIAIICVLLIPALGKAWDTKKASACLTNLHGFGTAFASYANRAKDNLPAYGTWDGATNPVSWNVALRKEFGGKSGDLAFKTPGDLGADNSVSGGYTLDNRAAGYACPAYEPKLKVGGVVNPSSYGVNYGGVFGYKPSINIPSPAPYQRGSAKLYKVPPSVFLLTDQQQPVEPPEPTSVIFNPAPGGWPLTNDRDGDGVNDTNTAFTPPARDVPYNGLDPRHPRTSANFLFADGSARAVKLEDWLANSGTMWGAADDSYR